ncbi:MAG TPA: M42 family metallopeptidase [Chloroflexota bacterium]
MNEDQFAFLRGLVESTGPSGYEEQSQAIWRKRVESSADKLSTDTMGNCMAVINPGGSPRVLLDAHIDEIGFIIRYIDDNGFLYFSTIGGFDPATLIGTRVRILGKDGPVLGVFGRKPIHLIDQDERKKAPDLKNMWIDIGVANRDEAETLVGVGDAGGRAHPLERLQGKIITSPSLDDRIGTYVVAEVARCLHGASIQGCLIAASSVQEEIGLRGARVSAFASEAQIGIAIDVTPTSDHPQASKAQIGDVRLGAGPVLTRGANTNPRVFRRLIAAAEAEGIPYQVEAIPGRTPTDEDAMQLTKAGMATGLLSIPTRYLHTAAEVLSLDDVDASVALLARFVRDLSAEIDLIP